MSAWEAIFLSTAAFGSMWACYCIGRREERQRWHKMRQQFLELLRQREAGWKEEP